MKNMEEQKRVFSILIVDDNQNNIYLLDKLLRREGYQNIKQAIDGIQALEIIKNEKIDLVLLDIMMPNMNGYEVLEQIRDHIIQHHLVVLMISAANEIDNVIRCIKLGAEDFLPKPFNADMLRVRVGSCFEKKIFINQEIKYLEQINIEKQRYQQLMHAIFPSSIATELVETGMVRPHRYKDVAVLFIDVVDFTHYCDTHTPREVTGHLQQLTELCENIAVKHKLQKIKTVGDAFIAVGNMFESIENPVLNCINYSEEILTANQSLSSGWKLRIGIDAGDVLGGVVGKSQFLFDIWGDVVNVASRIEALAAPNTICLSERAWIKVNCQCEGRSLGNIEIRGKGSMQVFRYEGKRKT